jgi:hypothetical protein
MERWKCPDAAREAIAFFSDVAIALHRPGIYHALEVCTKRIFAVVTRKMEPEALRKKVLNEFVCTERSLRNDLGQYVREIGYKPTLCAYVSKVGQPAGQSVRSPVEATRLTPGCALVEVTMT